MKPISVSHLVKSEDLNHHTTLFAGRMAEWFVEASFIAAAAAHGKPEEIVCLKLHGLKFAEPARKGDILLLTTRLVGAGNTSLTIHGMAQRHGEEKILVEGFVTFVCVDSDGRKKPHGLILPAAADAFEVTLRATAATLK